jgi:hypothetical protein
MLIEFDGDNPVFKQRAFLKVDYLPLRCEFDASGAGDRESAELFAKRKSPHWSYEQEYRLIVSLSLAAKKTTAAHTLYLLRIEPDFIKSVTLGLRSAPAFREQVLSLLSRCPLEHVGVFQIEADVNEFKLNRKKIK